MGATPFWFGPEDRRLFGWAHLPEDGQVAGGVVLCPPLGIEAICTYFTYRVLAEQLAERGLAVLRFDYDGTGDSVGGDDDPDRAQSWLTSVGAAVDQLGALGVGRVGLFGVRMGGLLAATAAAGRDDIDVLVLWDTCLSGSSFLREQQAFRMVSLGGDDSDDGSVEAPGMRFDAATAEALARLDLLRTEGRLARRSLILTHPARPRPRRLAQRFESLEVDWDEATGEEESLTHRSKSRRTRP